LFAEVVKNYNSFIIAGLGVGFSNSKPPVTTDIISEEAEVIGSKIVLTISRLTFAFDDASLIAKCGGDVVFAEDVKTFVLTREYFALLKKLSNDKLNIFLNGKSVELQVGKELFKSVAEKTLHESGKKK